MKAIILALLILGVVFAAQEATQATTEQSGSRNPGQLLVDHINGLILSVRQEQTTHDDIFKVQKNECDDELSFRKKEVADAVDALTRASEHRGRCSASHATANADFIKTKTYQQLMVDQLQFIATRRTDEAAFFTKKIDFFNNALSLLDQAEEIVQEFANGKTSFVQVTKHFNNMFIQSTKAGTSSDFAAVLAVLVEVGESQSGQVSSDQVERIRSLLGALREKLQQGVAAYSESENQAIADYLARKSSVEGVIEQLELTQNRLSAYIAQMQACMTKEDDIINSATSKRVRNQNILNYANDMCNAFSQEYDDATSARRREIELLGRLRTFVEQRTDEFSSYGGDVNDVFTTYSKSSDQGSSDANFLQLRANLRQRKL